MFGCYCYDCYVVVDDWDGGEFIVLCCVFGLMRNLRCYVRYFFFGV